MTELLEVSDETTYTKDEVIRLVDSTENLTERQFELLDGRAKFEMVTLDAQGREAAEGEDGTETIVIKIAGERFRLNVDSFKQSAKLIGFPQGPYLENTPIDLVIPHLNYWFDNLGGERKALIKDGTVLAYIRPGTEIYSTKQLVESMCSKLEEMGHSNYFFEKVTHDLYETQFAVVLPNITYDMPNGDVVLGGLQFQNSVLGLKALSVSGYIHHPGGAMISTTTKAQWDRRLGTTRVELDEMLENGSTEEELENVYDVYRWIKDATTDVLGVRRDFVKVAALNNFNIGSHVGTFFNDICKQYKIQTALRRAAQEEYGDQEGQTLYHLWKALTIVANRDEVSDRPDWRRHIMLVAGELSAHPDSCDGCHRLLED